VIFLMVMMELSQLRRAIDVGDDDDVDEQVILDEESDEVGAF